jgi:hypothetical protein
MKRDHWIIPESNLLIEKYSRMINREHLEVLDGSLFAKLDKSKQMLHLIDFSEASIINIKYDELNILFSDFQKRLGDNTQIKVAIYNGGNNKSDYLKMSTFSKNESDLIKISTFIELFDAFNWLELSNKDRALIWSHLGL